MDPWQWVQLLSLPLVRAAPAALVAAGVLAEVGKNVTLNAARRAQLREAMCRLADGDRAAFQPVFAALWPIVRAYCVRWLRDETTGEDAAQDALAKLFAQAHDFRADGDPVIWALTLATYECRTQQRRQQRTYARTNDLEHAPAATPEEIILGRDLEQLLHEALGELTDNERRLLQRVRGDGPMSAQQRKQRQRALDKLKLLWRRRHDAI